LWRGLAEVAEKYLRKGTKIYVEGKLKKRSWTDKEGHQRYATEVVGEDLTILSRPENQDRQSNYGNEGKPNPPSPLTGISSDSSDDLPF